LTNRQKLIEIGPRKIQMTAREVYIGLNRYLLYCVTWYRINFSSPCKNYRAWM